MAVPILKEPPITAREALIPYAMTGVNMLAPLIVAHDALSQMPLVFPTSVAMVILGLPVSVYFRRRRYNRIVLNLLTMLPLLILSWALTHTHPGLQIDWNNAMASVMGKDSYDVMNGLLLVFALLASGRAFILVSPVDILQTPLPSFSIFLLAAITSNTRAYPLDHVSLLDHAPLSLCCFLLLCMSTLYIFCFEQSQRWFSIHPPLRYQRRLIRWTFLFSVLMYPAIIGIGWALQPFNMFALARHAPLRRSLAWHLPLLGAHQFAFTASDNIDMLSAGESGGKQNMMTVRVRGKTQNLLWRAGTYSYYNLWTRQWQADELAPDFSAERHREDIAHADDSWFTVESHGSQVLTFRPDSYFSDPGLAEAIKERLIDPGAANGDARVIQTFNLQANILGDHEPIYGLYQIYQVSPAPPSSAEAATPIRDPADSYRKMGTSNSTIDQMQVAEDGSVSLKQADLYFRSYQVVSLIKPMPIMMPLAVDPVLPDRDKYLQMPPAEGSMGNSYIPGKHESAYALQIKKKALEILAENHLTVHSNAFDVVHQFDLYLGNHYRYTLTPEPPKGGVDPIFNFLFHQHEGYCTYFSSALVMLCRSIGFPARMVTGFAAGDMVENTGNTSETTYQVTSDDAHAWVEVFLPHYGWFTMDPTAGSRPVSTIWANAWDSVIAFFTDAKSLVLAVIAAVRKDAAARTDALLITLALALVGAGIFYLTRERPPTFPHRTMSDEQARQAVLASYRRMHRWLRLWGVIKPEGVTASEFERLFRSLNPAMGEIVGQLTKLYLCSRYGARTMRDADARQAITLLQQLWRLAPSERKHFYAQTVE